jgi:hypothetical protein
MSGEVVSLYQWGFLHDCELPAYSRGALCLPPERAIFKHLLDRQARSWFWPPVPVMSAVNPVLSY